MPLFVSGLGRLLPAFAGLGLPTREVALEIPKISPTLWVQAPAPASGRELLEVFEGGLAEVIRLEGRGLRPCFQGTSHTGEKVLLEALFLARAPLAATLVAFHAGLEQLPPTVVDPGPASSVALGSLFSLLEVAEDGVAGRGYFLSNLFGGCAVETEHVSEFPSSALVPVAVNLDQALLKV